MAVNPDIITQLFYKLISQEMKHPRIHTFPNVTFLNIVYIEPAVSCCCRRLSDSAQSFQHQSQDVRHPLPDL